MINTTTLSSIANGLQKVRRQGDYKFKACCPAHDDLSAYLAIKDCGDGRVLLQ